jgi:signal transduction histidine kinase
MSELPANLLHDIEIVQRIPIITSLLEVVCRTTGMGFAAVARVTKDSWIACAVRDEIAFGLEPGGELQLGTTICNEIRESHKAVIIDHVEEDAQYRHHHTPAMYGFQSYISMPIMLKDGTFFGTLCAIDPKPAELNNVKTIGMFTLFADLISFHLQSLELMERNRSELYRVRRQLDHSTYENRQYRFISHHNLQEPLRKIGMFSSMLVSTTDESADHKLKQLASKISDNARYIAMMIRDLSDFSLLDDISASLERTDLNQVLARVHALTLPELEAGNAHLSWDTMPEIYGDTIQLEQLFFNLVHNALRFSAGTIPPVIRISSRVLNGEEQQLPDTYYEIRVSDNGIGIEPSQLERIFDLFSQPMSGTEDELQSLGTGLAYCRKIVRNHGGSISVQSAPGTGSVFSVILPLNKPLS